MEQHYSVEDWLSKALDKNGNKPCFYMAVSAQRGPGKTYSMSRMIFEHWLETGEKFVLLTRNMVDVGNVANGILKSYMTDHHPDYTISEVKQMGGVFAKVYAKHYVKDENEEMKEIEEACGYVLAISASDKIKKISSLFVDTYYIVFDEIQPRNKSTYLPNEVDLFYDLYKSIARGDGSATRYLPVFLASNTIDLFSPWMVALDLTKHIQENTKRYRGVGVVYERSDMTALTEQHAKQPIDQALHAYRSKHGNDNTWLRSNKAIVAKPDSWGRGYYIATIIYNNEKLGLYEYPAFGLMYVSRKIDKQCKYIYNVTIDNAVNYPLLNSSNLFKTLKTQLQRGCVRCSDQGIQDIMFDMFA